MPLYHNEDQAMLAETASQFMAEEGAVTKQLRHWRDRDCKDGFGHALWKEMAELGFTGILVSEDDGGLGMGHVEAGIVLEEIGRNLTMPNMDVRIDEGVHAIVGHFQHAHLLGQIVDLRFSSSIGAKCEVLPAGQ